MVIEWQFDLSQGVSGEQCPERPEITCGIPKVGGETIHFMMNAHMGADADGVHYAWPRDEAL